MSVSHQMWLRVPSAKEVVLGFLEVVAPQLTLRLAQQTIYAAKKGR
jgi:hypothetical protein